ncbi:tol-pal system YbgF family protein [Cellulophaga sp. Hel_I_12]|uniref:tetratricopeptide repeat protein n=1 Tax=Cellulophaga sp. Hel_I_12 TaxID=1249972 RepID=UPI000646E0D7|nr:hypothetical protein [Cellulophaga sp. Hel_I_12]
MTIKEKLIENYILDTLTPQEKLAVDELLKNDVDFERELNFHINLKKVAQKNDEADFRNLIAEIETKAKTQNTFARPSYVKWLAAASIVLLLGLSYFLTTNKQASTNELFTSYFEPYRNVVQPLERSGAQQDQKSLAFYAYEMGEYQKAEVLFSDLYGSSKEPYYLFYKANALLKLERANEAVPLLLEHLKTKDTLTEKTNWYLALAYLKLEDKKNAKIVLEKVIEEGKYKTSEAQKLLSAFK